MNDDHSSSFRLRLHGNTLRALLVIGLTVLAIVPVVTTATRPLATQPAPDSIEYADGAWQLGHGHAYVTFYDERTSRFGTHGRPPRYPFGTSLALAPFAALGSFPHSIQVGSRVISLAYIFVMVAASWTIGDAVAAGVVAAMLAVSPFARESGALILSDALAALLSVAILLILASGRGNRSAAAAGLLAGMLVCVRLLGIVALPAVLVAVSGRRRWWALAGAVPFGAALALYQWDSFGSPFRTGYSYWLPHLRQWSTSFVLGDTAREGPFIYADRLRDGLLKPICPCGIGGAMTKLPNLALYPSVLVGMFWIFAPPLTGLVGIVQAVRCRATPAGRYALVLVPLNALIVMFYFAAAPRYVAPAASVLTVYAAVGVSALLKVMPRAWRSATMRLQLRPRG